MLHYKPNKLHNSHVAESDGGNVGMMQAFTLSGNPSLSMDWLTEIAFTRR